MEGRGKPRSGRSPCYKQNITEPAERVTERWLNSLQLFCHPLRGL